MAGFLLLHSPLVGPGTWKPVAQALRARGHAARAPSLRLAELEAPYFPALAERALAAAAPDDVVVAHSGGGVLAPAAMASGDRRGAILIDALTPRPGRRWMSSVTEHFAETLLARLTDEGRLPPWNTWFEGESFGRALPAGDIRAAFIAELEPLPLAYFEEPEPDWPPIDPRRAIYLQLSAPYVDDARLAVEAGWRLEILAARHLAMLTEPDRIAEALIALAEDFPPLEPR